MAYRGVIMYISNVAVLTVYIGLYILSVHHGYPEVVFFRNGYYLLYVMYALTLVFFNKIYRPFWVGEQRIREMCAANILALSFVDALAYGYLSLIAVKLLPALPMFILFVVQAAVGTLYIVKRTKTFYQLYPPVSALYVYANAAELAEMQKRFQYEKARVQIVDQIEQTADPKEIFRKIDAKQAVITGRISMALRDQIMHYSYDEKKDFYLLETIADVKTHCGKEISVYDMQLIRSKAHGFSIGLRMAKRTMDVICSAVGLLVFGLPILVCALIVHLQDGGDPFFRQDRLTRDGKVFTLVKLRSMVMNAEKDTGAVISSDGDARITKFGKFLRASHIDELPQFWNVLKGDLSMVGPRPERPELHVNICADYPYFRYRLLVKAGMTGYAQVYGRYDTPSHQKLRMDMRYIETASIGMDFKILLYTLMKVFVKESRIEESAKVIAKGNKGEGKDVAA